MPTEHDPAPASQDTTKVALNKRLEDIGWGLFLIMIGCIWLVPQERVPEGTWLVGTGLLLLALNAVRYLNDIAMSGFTNVLGVLALAAGVGDLLGLRLPLFAICLIIFGASILLKAAGGTKA
jgi:hypothetical protein